MKNPTNFAYHLTQYLSKYLPGQLGASTHTIQSYRDTFTLCLRYLQTSQGISPDKLTLEDFTKNRVEEFLIWLEEERKCSIATRNQRLAALQAFFRYLQIESPVHIFLSQQILSIRSKRTPKPVMNYLAIEGIQAILAAVDTAEPTGRRDFALLCLLYDTGARVQEIADCLVRDLRLTEPATLRLTGKGCKSRIVPILSKTAALLKQYLEDQHLNTPDMVSHSLFSNRKREKLTRAGISYILQKYVECATKSSPELIPANISPHSLRHSKAMHLLQAGVNLVYIRDLLGHADIATTEIYARADAKMKRQALENAYKELKSNPSDFPWQEDQELFAWLQNLCRANRIMRSSEG
jgi:integrase/recombinase XerD